MEFSIALLSVELKTNKCKTCDEVMRSGNTFCLQLCSQGIKFIREGMVWMIPVFFSFPLEQTYYYSIQSSGSCKDLFNIYNMYYIYYNSIQRSSFQTMFRSSWYYIFHSVSILTQ